MIKGMRLLQVQVLTDSWWLCKHAYICYQDDLLLQYVYHISRNIGKHYIWRFAQKTLLVGF